MSYIQLKINTNIKEVDLITEVLYGIGALSIDFSDRFNNPIFEPPIGTNPLWQAINLKILFAENTNQKHITTTLKEICSLNNFEFENLANIHWENECKKKFKPMLFGDNLWVYPSWNSAKTCSGTVINMDPGLAFGTGAHQTTHLCLEYLANNPPVNQNVIDYGSGSGILAIAAKKLGGRDVTAVDHDPQAILATKNNAQHNHTQITICHSDNKIKLAKVNLLIANILANPLVELASHFSSLIQVGGKIVLSGILKEQEQMVNAAYNVHFKDMKITQKDEWLLITGTKK